MSYSNWIEEHSSKHKKIIDKLVQNKFDEEQIIEYFNFDNMVIKEPDFCPLYIENKKCHEMDSLNCYLCSCPNFRFKDDGIKKIQNNIQYSFCDINSQDGRQGIYANAIHQDCSRCSIPHHKAYVKKHFNLNWYQIMQGSVL